MTLNPGETCAQCGAPMISRPLHPFPVLVQALFGLSFILFLIFFDRVQQHLVRVWAWSGIQIALGLLLIRGRMRAKKRILRCIRCNPALT